MIRHRADSNQQATVRFLRSIPGVSVEVVSGGVCAFDLVVGLGGRSYLFELKRSAKAKLKPSQIAFGQTWRGHWRRVNNVKEILDDLGIKFNEKYLPKVEA